MHADQVETRKRIALVRQGDRPRLNERLASLLSEAFPEYTVDDLDVLRLVRRRPLTLACCVIGGVGENFANVTRRRMTVKKAMLTSTAFARTVTRLVGERVSPVTHVFTLQSQSLFPSKVPGVPHFIFTDHAHLANLAYPFFDVRGLAGPRFLERERSMYRSASRVFVRSENISQILELVYGVPRRRVVAVGVGPNVPTPDHDRPDRWHDGRIVFVGVDWHRKGGPLLVEAFQLVRRRHPQARLEIIGCHPDLDEVPGVTVHGKLAPAAVAAILAESDVFCLPTREEPFGVAFIEAMHAGLAVVGTRIGAIPDFVRDGETGALVEPDDVHGLADTLSLMLDQPDRTRALGAAGRALAHERYRWEAVIARIREEVNLTLLDPSGSAGEPTVATPTAARRGDGGGPSRRRRSGSLRRRPS